MQTKSAGSKITVLLFILLFFLNTHIQSQRLPRKPTIQQIAGYYNWQQQNWQRQQLPLTSVTYRFGNATYRSTAAKEKEPPVLPFMLIRPEETANAPFLQLYLKQQRKTDMLWQKQSWWKDPSKAPGAQLLQDIYRSNRKN